MKWIPSVLVAGTAVATVGALAPIAVAQQRTEPTWSNSHMPAGDWRTINRDLAATRYSPLDQINTHNVASLERVWSYQLNGNSTAVPLVIDGVMYVTSGDRVVALDAESGEEIWAHVARSAGEGGRGARVSTRGVGYWEGDEETPPRILFMSGSNLVAVDAASGAPAAGFGNDGYVDVGVPYGGTPTIYRHVAVIGAAVGEVPQGPPGNPRAFDVRTGEKLWEFWTVPRPGEPFNETWGDGWEDRSGTNMWAFAAPVDAARGIVYLPIAGPAPNYYGGGRPGENVFGNSIVAVEAQTGEYLWHFQTVHHDLWDADMPSGGALFDVILDGQRVPTLTHVGKTSYLFVLNRITGEPVIEVEERPVPKGDVPGEWYSPTQPFPVKPPPLSRVSFTRAEIVTPEETTPEHSAACHEFWERSGGFYNAGPFTPFMYQEKGAPPKSTIQFPGGTGGVNWGGVAADPTSGIIYVNAQNTSLVGWVEEKDPNVTYSFEAVGSTQPYDRASILGVGPFFSYVAPISGEWDENGRPVGPTLPCSRPPWAKLIAVDTNSGEIVWESVLGVNELLPDDKRLVGNAGSAGPTVTGGDLVFVGATNDRRFRAFDARTGQELWSTRLEGNANANPMSYAGRSGKQHVAVVAGDTVNVFALR
jgi:quinoprotein glucose dehydrogenase